jgi:hypothetical protein
MSGLRYITRSGRSCSGFPFSAEKIAEFMAGDAARLDRGEAVDPIKEVLQPGRQAMGRPIGGDLQAKIVRRAAELVLSGFSPSELSADEVAFLEGVDR